MRIAIVVLLAGSGLNSIALAGDKPFPLNVRVEEGCTSEIIEPELLPFSEPAEWSGAC